MCLVLHPPRLHPKCQLPSECQAQSPHTSCHVLLTGSQRRRNHMGSSAYDGVSSSPSHCTLKTAARLTQFGGCLHHPFPVRSLKSQEGQMIRNSQAVTGPGSLNLSSQNDLHFQFLVPSHRLLQGSCGDQILVAQRERLAPLVLSGSLQRVPRAVPTKRTMRPLRASAAPQGESVSS